MATSRRIADRHIPDLGALEDELSVELETVNIIGELDLDRSLRASLYDAFDYYLRRRSIGGLLRSYGTCFVVHLVAEGIYGYDSGNYWSGVPLKKRRSQSELTEGAQFFEQFIRERGLEFFPDQSRRYVGLILLHGGMPNDALDTFFEHCLAPAVFEGRWPGSSVTDLLRLWTEEASSRHRLSQPAQAFFREGGRVAADFVDRCLKMAEYEIDTKARLTAKEAGLPERVVSAYRSWLRSQEEAASATGSSRAKHQNQRKRQERSWKRPALFFEPAYGGIVAELPAQTFETGEQGGQPPSPRWEMQAEGRADAAGVSIDLHVYRAAEEWQAASENVAVEPPARSYTLRLADGCGKQQTWTFEGVRPEAPFMAFDGETCERVAVDGPLPAQTLWLLVPKDAPLRAEGGRKVEESISLAGAWGAYRAERWDLSHAHAARIGEKTYPVVKQGQGLRPCLSGGKRLGLGGRLHPYYRVLPEVVIPVVAAREVAREPHAWRLTVARDGEPPHVNAPLADLGVELRPSHRTIALPLAGVIEDIGAYEIRLQGPLGRSCSFSLRFVGETSVMLPTVPRVPVQGADPEGQILLSTPSTPRCASPHVHIDHEGGYYAVTFGPEQRHALLTLADEASGATVELPLVAPVLRWSVRDEDGLRPWTSQPLREPSDWLDQSNGADLVVQAMPHQVNLDLQGHVRVERKGHVAQTLPSRGRASGQLRFNLLEASELFAEGECALAFNFVLEAGAKPTVCPVLRLTPTLRVQGIELDARRDQKGRWSIEASWHDEGRRVSGRCLRLWSLGRPWEDVACTLRIDDDADKHQRWTLDASHPLTPGPYLAEMAVEDPWATSMPSRPLDTAPEVAQVEIGSAAERIKHAWQQEPDSFSEHVEQALLSAHRQDRSDVGKHLKQAENSLRPGDLVLAVRALWHRARKQPLTDVLADPRNVVEQWLQLQVLDHGAWLLDALASDAWLRDRPRDALRRLLVELGVMSRVAPCWRGDALRAGHVDALWSLWPPLGWLLESDSLLGGHPAALRRAEHAMGIAELLDASPAEGARPATGEIAAGTMRATDNHTLLDERGEIAEATLRPLLCTDVFGERMSGQEIGCRPQVLEAQQASLSAELRGHFDDEKSLLAVHFDWLISAKRQPGRVRDAVGALEEGKTSLCAALEKLGLDKPFTAPVVKLVLNRFEQLEGANPLTNVPFAVGAVALLQRAQALTRWRHSLPSQHDLPRYAVAAFTVASRLYERDLCLVDLALRQARAEA